MPTILVVEDFDDTRLMMKMWLSRIGYRVLEAETGQEGVEMAQKERPDLIIMDMMMPGMNGNAFLRIIRNDQRRKYLPVVVLTALNSGEVLRSVSELGVQEWLLKADYSGQQLIDAVDRLSYPPAGPRASNEWQNVRWSQQN